jgi:hypothetical protein
MTNVEIDLSIFSRRKDMPLQNRVDPWGRLHAVSSKGTLLGNRGILHNANREIIAPWKHKAWVTCALTFENRRRQIFSKGNYSELFFLDEATALAAGHRPCAECRRDRFNEFKSTWLAGNSDALTDKKKTIAEIDRIMHTERAIAGGGKRIYEAELGTLRPGVIVSIDDQAYLLWAHRLLLWSFGGYQTSTIEVNPTQTVAVLTPRSVVNAIAQGFEPIVHRSANV